MERFDISQYSPSKVASNTRPFTSPQRVKVPSPEKYSLPYLTILTSPKRTLSISATTETGSPSKKSKLDALDTYLDVRLDQLDRNVQQSLVKSKDIQLPFPLVQSGLAIVPSSDQFSTLLRLIPNTFAVEVRPPYLLFRVRELPLKPWPFSICGLPVDITTEEHGEKFQRGKIGRGKPTLPNLSLREPTSLTDDILKSAIEHFLEAAIKIRDVYWFAGFWVVTILDEVEWKTLPALIAGSPAYYRTAVEYPDPDPAALRKKAPRDLEYDDTNYVSARDAVLRPGIMLSSSAQATTTDGQFEDAWKNTTSGVLVADTAGELFITVASHGFEEDGLVYHPNPQSGEVIGRIVSSLPHTDISMVKLNPGLRYTNETFGNDTEPDGTKINGIVANRHPHMRTYDSLNMNNPFSGYCIGTVLAVGARIIGEPGDKSYVRHEWHTFENGDQAVDGSCGSAVLDAEGRLAGLFRFKHKDSAECLCASAIELREFGYEICGGVQTF